MRKSILALIVVSSFASMAAKADVNQAINLVDSMANHSVSWNEARSEWNTLDQTTRQQARSYDHSQGTNYTGDFGNTAQTMYGTKTNSAGNPVNLHQTATATPAIDRSSHLDGTHSEPVTPHNDAPANIDRSSHLDGNHQSFDNATHLDGAHHETAQPGDVATPRNGKDGNNGSNGVDGVSGSNGKDGVNGTAGRNGSNGSDGKDGITTTVVKVDTATQQRVNDNSANIAANRGEIINHSRAISRNSAAIEHNSQRIDKNSKDIADNRKAIKHVGAMASASANLHYNVNHNGYAVAVGEYKGATAVAGGVQFQTGEHTAVTLQASYDGEAVGASVGFHGDF